MPRLPTPKSLRVVMAKRLSCLARSPLLKTTPGKVSEKSGEVREEGHGWPLTTLVLFPSQEGKKEKDAHRSLEMQMQNTRGHQENYR